jgi:divalent metal cation (Fe/Co/Zn/Cd) transporter
MGQMRALPPLCGVCGASAITHVPTCGLRLWATRLALFTIAWNVVEAVIAVAAGADADSIALIGFGLDSAIEAASGAIVLWRLRQWTDDHDEHHGIERRAARSIAATLFLLAAYVAADSVLKLAGIGERPMYSAVGLVVLAVSMIVMPALWLAKRNVARAMGSATLAADAAETLVCVYLGVPVLLGLLANAALGWWWMDPLAGLVVATLAAREGREAWSSGELCDH